MCLTHVLFHEQLQRLKKTRLQRPGRSSDAADTSLQPERNLQREVKGQRSGVSCQAKSLVVVTLFLLMVLLIVLVEIVAEVFCLSLQVHLHFYNKNQENTITTKAKLQL